jgi:hypothetical protein
LGEIRLIRLVRQIIARLSSRRMRNRHFCVKY